MSSTPDTQVIFLLTLVEVIVILFVQNLNFHSVDVSEFRFGFFVSIENSADKESRTDPL